MRDLKAEDQVRRFYDEHGWKNSCDGERLNTNDAELWEDLRDCAKEYVSSCRLRLLEHLPKDGDKILDAASGPIQYPEYLEYSKGFKKRVCVDISQRALDDAAKKIGDHGEFFCASLLELPFKDNTFDAVISLHTIYHIEASQQEQAVRQLIRVAKPNSKIVILYANPDKIFARIKRLFIRDQKTNKEEEPLYYFAHPLSWWKRFGDACDVEIYPWRSLTAQDAKRLIPDNLIGKSILQATFLFEKNLPGLATQLGAYPMIVLKKKEGLVV